MSYNVTILGKKYDLPSRTMAVDDGIEAMSKLDEQYKAREITRRNAVEQMYNFVESLAPGALPALEEVDTNDLLKACTDVILAYDAPARRVRNEAQLAEVRDLINRPEVAKLLEAAKSVK